MRTEDDPMTLCVDDDDAGCAGRRFRLSNHLTGIPVRTADRAVVPAGIDGRYYWLSTDPRQSAGLATSFALRLVTRPSAWSQVPPWAGLDASISRRSMGPSRVSE